MHSAHLIYLGDLRLTVALVGAVFVLLLAARAYRLAGHWCIAAGSAFGVVAASKIMYLGWGLQWSSLDFKAVSGHAAGAATVWPIVLSLVAASQGRHKESIGLLTGWGLSIVVASSLVANGEHALSEAFAGWCIGALASVCVWIKLRKTTIRPSTFGFGVALAATILIAACMQVVPAGWWMIKTALALSGGRRVHAWND